MQISIYLFDFDSRALNFSRGLGKINNEPLHSGENEVLIVIFGGRNLMVR